MQSECRKIMTFTNAIHTQTPVYKRNHRLQYEAENPLCLSNTNKHTPSYLDLFINFLNLRLDSGTYWCQNVYPLIFTKILIKTLPMNTVLFLGHINFWSTTPHSSDFKGRCMWDCCTYPVKFCKWMFFFWYSYLGIYLAVPGLTFCTQDLLAEACGISILQQGLNSCTGSLEA